MSKGYKCPLCGSYYAEGIGYCSGDTCGNMAMTGPTPEKCTPEHPGKGILRPVEDKDISTD